MSNDDFDLNDYADDFTKAEQKYNLPPGLLYRVAKQESNGDPTAESDAGAQGLMQLMPETAKALNVDPFIPSDAINGSARLLRENLDRYKNLPDALRAYNAGTDKSKWGNKETQNYVTSITADLPAVTTMKMIPMSGSEDPLMQSAAQVQSDDPLMAAAAQVKSGQQNASQDDDPLMAAAKQVKTGITTSDIAPVSGVKTSMGGNTISSTQAASEVTASPVEQSLQQKIDALPLPQRIAANLMTHPENASVFGAMNMLLGGKPLNQQKSISDTPAADYTKDYVENVKNAAKSAKDLLTFTNKPNPINAAVQAKDKAGLPVSADERAQAFNEAVANNPGGEAATIAQVLPGVSAATSFMGRTVNPLISSITGATPAEVQAGENALPIIPGASKIIKDIVNNSAEDIGDIGKAGLKNAVDVSPIPTERQVNEKISRIAGGDVAPDLTEYVPGSKPTLATATANPALATEERALRRDNPNAFPVMENQTARANYLQDIVGTPQDLDALRAAREEQAIPLKTEAFANKRSTDAQPVLDHIEEILKSPAGKNAAVRSNLNEVRKNLYDNLDPETGALETDPEQLEGVRQAIASSLTKQAELSGSTARQASRQLSSIMDTLDNTIEKGAPGYANYRKTYSDMSKPIDEKEYLQDAGFTDSNGNVVPKQITLNKVERVLNNIKDGRNAGGVNPAKNISAETITKLENIRSDLRREANIDLGKNRGSTTTQELSRGKKNIIGNMLTGAFATAEYSHNPIVSGAAIGARMLYNYKNALIQRSMLDKFVNPEKYVSAATGNPLHGNIASVPAPVNNLTTGINNIQVSLPRQPVFSSTGGVP